MNGQGEVGKSGFRVPGLWVALALALFTGGVVGGSGCATNPATGEKEFSLISESQEIQMGKEGDQSILAQFGKYEDEALDAYVSGIGKRLAAVSERPDLPWTFRVLDDPIVNAFALPGGYIYISRGILAVINNEAQLAGVLGHEIGHVTARHSARQISRAQLAQLGLGLGSIFVPEFEQFGGIASAGLGLLFLKYGRGDENQADELGIRYAVRAGYDPRAIPATYDALEHLQEESGQSLPGFLSTHPDPGDRKIRTAQLAEQAVAANSGKSWTVAEAGYKNRIEKLVFGPDPRQGFVEAGVYYHPELRFRIDFPRGWKIANARTAVTASNADQKAAIQLSLVPAGNASSPSAHVNRLLADRVIADARGSSTTISGWPAWVGEVVVVDGQGNRGTLLAAWVQRESGRFYQFLGAPTAVAGSFRGTLDSFRVLTEADKLNRKPDRVHGASVSQPTATVSTVANSFSKLAVPVDKVAFLNNLEPNSVVKQGFVLKVVLEP